MLKTGEVFLLAKDCCSALLAQAHPTMLYIYTSNKNILTARNSFLVYIRFKLQTLLSILPWWVNNAQQEVQCSNSGSNGMVEIGSEQRRYIT